MVVGGWMVLLRAGEAQAKSAEVEVLTTEGATEILRLRLELTGSRRH